VKSSIDWHSKWLISSDSAQGCEHGCKDYHLLAPVLHSLGFFLSYERYGPEIRQAFKMVEEFGIGKPRILVVGAESEESLRALIAALPKCDYRIDVLDRCVTPLQRIINARGIEEHDIHIIHSEVLDLHNQNTQYDLIVSDSFLKQITPNDRVKTIKRLSSVLSSNGIALFREYIGVHSALLDDFWLQLETRLEEVGWYDRASLMAKQVLRDRMPRLQAFMAASGGSYTSESALITAMSAGGFSLIRELPSGVRPYTIAFFRRTS
jgi:hypothetical protein